VSWSRKPPGVAGQGAITPAPDQQESSQSLVGEFEVRLISERRSEENPSGLLVAGYGERLIAGGGPDASLKPSAGNRN